MPKLTTLLRLRPQVPLASYAWSPRTVLVLGNERLGLVASVLARVDDCVEIEQRGVVRSLNVHVSAALACYCALFAPTTR